MKSDTPHPKISVIIPNLHSPIIDKTIESVIEQETSAPYEIIVVGMDKWNLVKKYPEVKFIETTSPVGAAAARNIGIKNATGEWLFFIDSDCIALNGWLETLRNDFNNGWKVVGGGTQSPQEPFWALVYNLSMLHGNLTSDKRRIAKFLPTLNLGVHREVVEKIGLMDETLMRGQDVDWTVRMTLAGYRLLFNPLVKVEHQPLHNDLKSLREMNSKSGYYMINIRHKFPEIFTMPKILRKSQVWTIFAPLIAAVTTFKIFLSSKEVRNHLRTIPYIYLLKLSWCRGAARGLKAFATDE